MNRTSIDAGRTARRSKYVLVLPWLIVIVAGLVSLRYVRSGVPTDLYLLTGAEGSTFYVDGQHYAEAIRPYGIRVHVVPTRGSLDNMRRLATEDLAQAAFTTAGIDRQLPKEMTQDLESLGSLYIQPAWLFVRTEFQFDGIKSLAGRRVVMGVNGSGARTLAELMIETNGLQDQVITAPFDELPPAESLRAIREGEVDAIFAMGMPGAPLISDLLHAEGIRPVSFPRIAAYVRRYEYLAKTDLPEGAVDLAANIPRKPLELLSLPTNLVVSDDLHPALIDLMLMAGQDVHGTSTLFTDAGDFPSAKFSSLPLSAAARRFYTEGPSRWRKYLPFWLASLLDRFIFVICTVATASVAAFGILPKLMTARFNFSMLLLFKQLSQIENRADDDHGEALAATDELLQRSAQLNVPTSQVSRYMEFRQAVHDLRDRLRAR